MFANLDTYSSPDSSSLARAQGPSRFDTAHLIRYLQDQRQKSPIYICYNNRFLKGQVLFHFLSTIFISTCNVFSKPSYFEKVYIKRMFHFELHLQKKHTSHNLQQFINHLSFVIIIVHRVSIVGNVELSHFLFVSPRSCEGRSIFHRSFGTHTLLSSDARYEKHLSLNVCILMSLGYELKKKTQQ